MGHPSYAVPVGFRPFRSEGSSERRKRKKKHRKDARGGDKREVTDEKMDPIVEIPDEIWVLVFAWVDQERDRVSVLLTCKTWNRIGKYELDPSIKNDSFFVWAIRRREWTVVKELLKDERVEPDRLGQPPNWGRPFDGHPQTPEHTPMCIACRCDKLDVVREFLKNSKVMTVQIQQALWTAIRSDRRKIVRELLKDGRADPSSFDNEAVIMASHHGSIGALEELAKDGRVDPSTRNNRAVRVAMAAGRSDVLSILFGLIRPVPVKEDEMREADGVGLAYSHTEPLGTCEGSFEKIPRELEETKKGWIRCLGDAGGIFYFCGILMVPDRVNGGSNRVMNCECVGCVFVRKGTWEDNDGESIEVVPCSDPSCSSVGCRECADGRETWTCPLDHPLGDREEYGRKKEVPRPRKKRRSLSGHSI